MIDYLLVSLLGASAGSFISMISYRLPLHLDSNSVQLLKSLSGRSLCPTCNKAISVSMLIPILSWITRKGKSACCQTSISWRYPAIEVSALLLSVCVFYLYSHYIDLVTPWYWSLEFWLVLIFSYLTLTISITDLEHYLIPDRLSLPLLWLGLIAASIKLPHWHITLEQSLYGAIFGYLVLWLVFQLHYLFTGRESMGYGDFKLLAALGAWVGLQEVSLILGISSFSFILIALVRQKLKPDHVMPFGPFLITAAWAILVATTLGFRFF